jgi:HD-GYP domain-containing protein (c-di-GMP phosphodiesterase class II)
LAGIKFLEGGINIVYCHHERWDGAGYPRRLRGEEIPLGARIFSVADTLDALTSDRPDRKALSYEAARAEIRRHCGSQFDPRAVDTFLEFGDTAWKMLREEAEDLARTIQRQKRDSLEG